MNVFMLVGEDSGDSIAASLVGRLKGMNIKCFGIGGPQMKAAGFDVLFPMENITAFGILEALPKLPYLIKIKTAIIEEIEKRNPDVVITVDFPEFNFLIAKGLKNRGNYKGKIIHYVAPSVWAWRESRAKKVAQFLDGIMCLFPMEVDYFTKHGLKAVYVGHPLVEKFVSTPKEKSYRALKNIPDDTIILGLFFGSRDSEFKNMREIIITAAKYIIESKKNIHILVPTLQKNEFRVQTFVDGINAPLFISTNPSFKWAAFEACDVAIAVSGTVGLELAYANVPHVITYKVNPLTYFILKLMVKVKKIHLTNIILNKDVIPEFIQNNAEPEKIAGRVLELIKHKEKREDMKKDFAQLREILGGNNKSPPSQQAADFILSLIKK